MITIDDFVNSIKSGSIQPVDNRGGSGLSVIYNGFINNQQVIVKVFPDPSNKVDCENEEQVERLYGQKYESDVYSSVIWKLSAMSPNFLNAVAILNVDVDKRNLNEVENFLDDIVNKTGCKFTNIIAVVLPYVKNISLDKFITQGHNMIIDFQFHFRKVMAQIILSLAVMQVMGLMHNDLHTNNIMIHTLDKPYELTYNIGPNMVFKIPEVKYMVVMFDWDFSYYVGIGGNPQIRQFSYLGINNMLNPVFDIYTVLCVLYGTANIPYDFKQFMQRVTGKNDKQINEYHYMVRSTLGFPCRVPLRLGQQNKKSLLPWNKSKVPLTMYEYLFEHDKEHLKFDKDNMRVYYDNGIDNFINMLQDPYFKHIIK